MEKVSNIQPPGVNHLAFVDDTIWISKSKQRIQTILKMAKSFFQRNDISINANKTETIHIAPRTAQTYNPTDTLTTIKFCNQDIKIVQPHTHSDIWAFGSQEITALYTRSKKF